MKVEANKNVVPIPNVIELTENYLYVLVKFDIKLSYWCKLVLKKFKFLKSIFSNLIFNNYFKYL